MKGWQYVAKVPLWHISNIRFHRFVRNGYDDDSPINQQPIYRLGNHIFVLPISIISHYISQNNIVKVVHTFRYFNDLYVELFQQ